MTLAAGSDTHQDPELVQRLRWRRLFSLPHLLTAMFLLVCAPFALTHAMWIDEAQAFLIARDSHSLRELFANLRYEGHPPLWHLLLYALTRFTTDPFWMQALHLLMAAGSVYLLARFSPLPLAVRLLFPFGYFPLFEYGIIARNYQVVMLLAFGFCALWSCRHTAYAWLGLLLGMMCLGHLMGVLIACGLGLMLLADALASAEGRAAIRRRPHWFLLGLLLAGAGGWASAVLMNPPADSGYAVGWHFAWDHAQAWHVVSILRDGLLPIPARSVHFWDYHLVDESSRASWQGLLLGLGALLLLGASWRGLLVFVVAAGGQLAFSYVKFFGGVRHHGELFIALLCALWIAWTATRKAATPPSSWRRAARLAATCTLALYFAVHVYSGAVALWFEAQVPFAAGREAGQALRAVVGPDDLLVSDCEFVTPSLAVSLPGRSFYFPATQRQGTFVIWRGRGAWNRSGIAPALQLAAERHKTVYFITAYRLPRLPPGVTEVGYFSEGILEMEHFAIYRIGAR